MPDVVVIPVGDGVTFSGIAKGFRELRLCGATNKQPRLIGVQATGCQPLKMAWERNDEVCPAQPATIADGIAVGIPIYATITLRDIRESAIYQVHTDIDEKQLSALIHEKHDNYLKK